MSLLSCMLITLSVSAAGLSSCFGQLSLPLHMLGRLGRSLLTSKCVLMSTSAAVRRDMKAWVISGEGEHWSVKLDVRDLGGHLDTTYRAWGRTLVARVLAVLRVVWLVSALPLDYRGKLRILSTMYIPAALHGIEASLLSPE